MKWRYEMAQRLAFINLILSVVMMLLLPWPTREVEPEEPELDLEE